MFKRLDNVNLTKNKVVQISNNTVCNLPLVSQGFNIQDSINYQGTFNYYHISNLQNYILIFLGNNIFIYNTLSKQKEQTILLDSNITNIKTAKLTKNQLVIAYSIGGFSGGEVRVKILSCKDNSLTLSNLKTISSLSSDFISVCCLDSETIITSYFAKKSMFDKDVFPRISLLKLNNNNIDLIDTYVYSKKEFNENLDEVKVYLTRLTEEEFIFTYAYKNRYNCNAISSVFCIDSQLNINKHKESWEFNGNVSSNGIDYNIIQIQNLSNNLILYFDDQSRSLYLKSLTKIDDDYNTTTLSTLNLNYSFNKMCLLSKDKDTLRFALFNSTQSVIIKVFNNQIFLEKKLDVNRFYKDFKYTNCNNSLFALLKNQFLVLEYSQTTGKVLGLAQDSHTVYFNGACKLSGITLELGKSYFYDKDGTLTTNSEGNNYIGYAVSTDTIVVFPQYIQNKTKTVSRKYNGQFKANTVIKINGNFIGLHTGNGKVVIQGFAKLSNIALTLGSKYYYSDNGSITTNNKWHYLGYAISNNILFIPNYLI